MHSRLERVDEDVGKDKMRMRTSRRCYREFKIKKVWLLQTQRQINSGNDYVRTPLVLGLQSAQGVAVIESIKNLANVIKSKFTKPMEICELIYRKIKYCS